jgi:predicted Fe-Mo cluster-binding NifX family protein
MKIAIAATESGPDGKIHYAFGKSPHFIVFDSATGETKVIHNPVQTSEVSTGVEVARILVDQRIEKVVAGMFGERVQRVFSDAGAQVEVVSDKTVNEYIRSLPTLPAGVKPLRFPSAETSYLDNDPARIERGSCYCSSCGYSIAEESEAPCFQRYCPECKTPLERKF